MADPGNGEGAPRWVKVLAVTAAVLLALVVLLKVAGLGDHGPGRHGGAGVLRDAPAVLRG